MAARPPQLPAEILGRVLRLARADGRILLFVAGGLALVAALVGDKTGAIAGCFVAGAGAMELHGVQRLRHGDPDGIHWLVRSQLTLLAIVLIYAAWMLTHYNPQLLDQLPADVKQELQDAGLPTSDLRETARFVYQGFYTLVGTVTLLYQGSMAVYYYRRRDAVRVALIQER